MKRAAAPGNCADLGERRLQGVQDTIALTDPVVLQIAVDFLERNLNGRQENKLKHPDAPG